MIVQFDGPNRGDIRMAWAGVALFVLFCVVLGMEVTSG